MQYLMILLTLGVAYVNPVMGLQSTCQVSYYKLGCFQDSKRSRTMSEMLISDRDNSGETIDWNNWTYYMQGLACRCAQAASSKGYTTFGLQFYGECWSGPESCDQYSRYGDSEYCIGKNYTRCDINDETECMGQENTNFVYLLLEEPEDETPVNKQ